MRKYVILLHLFVSGFCFSQTNTDQLLVKRLDSAFTDLFHPDEPGGTVFIQQGATILYQRSFGLADLTTREKFSENTLSNLGSISKTFVAYGILLLQNQGKLSIEDPIIKYFPEFKNKDLAGKIRIKHLLTHTSGLPDSRHVMQDSIFYLTAKDDENFKPLTFTDTLKFEPGSNWDYSNPSYNGLALIIEKVSKMKWQEFIQKNIFQPAGMKKSTITDGAYPDKNVAHAYSLKNNQYSEDDYGEFPTFAAAGNGGVWSSVAELRKYVDAIEKCSFADCNTIKKATELWTPPNWQQPRPVFHSGVWFVHKSITLFANDKEQCRTIEHSGSQGGFRAHLILIPENKITIIWLTNNSKSLTGVIKNCLYQLHYIQ
jgi:CubicO group peptidase (beta-lactamase class C family)